MATALTLHQIVTAIDTATAAFAGHRCLHRREIDAMADCLADAHNQLGGRLRRHRAHVFDTTARHAPVADVLDALDTLRRHLTVGHAPAACPDVLVANATRPGVGPTSLFPGVQSIVTARDRASDHPTMTHTRATPPPDQDRARRAR